MVTTLASQQSALAGELLEELASSTGLEPGAPPRRYLWTDAFAVCGFLSLHRERGERRFLNLALRLVDQAHHTLGRHRPDDRRRGWILGLDDSSGERHPTLGGLRIGKQLPERGADEPYDPDLEWERDGQYFHYLTKWMHALHRVSQETGDPTFHRWARELAVTAHGAFTYRPPLGGPQRMVWKMSIDLSRPLVPSMGHHDPLDALATYLELQDSAPPGTGGEALPDLEAEIRDAVEMCAGASWSTLDPLGIGGLLCAAAQLAGSLAGRGADLLPLLRQVLADSVASLQVFSGTPSLAGPASRRLAFRELGLAIGLHAIERQRARLVSRRELALAAAALPPYLRLASRIEDFWADPANRQSRQWADHRDINAVMLATSLAPAGFLGP